MWNGSTHWMNEPAMQRDFGHDSFLRETEHFFHEQIPITRQMGIRVEAFDARQGMVLTAPLEPNHNHLGTAFGGSLAAVATLAGYGMLWMLLEDRQAHVVIKSSSLRYLHPVTREIRAVCKPPEEKALVDFRTAFLRNGKARLGLEVTISEDGRPCVTFEGIFVALKENLIGGSD